METKYRIPSLCESIILGKMGFLLSGTSDDSNEVWKTRIFFQRLLYNI